jgi:hypothetical protein
MPDGDVNALPRSAKEALANGVKYYFTGKPCSRGHVDQRRADNNNCTVCCRDLARAGVNKPSRNLHCKKRSCPAAKRLLQHVRLAVESAGRQTLDQNVRGQEATSLRDGMNAARLRDGKPPLPATIKEARAIGTLYYFTGAPCKHGHVDIRRVDNLGCAECLRLATAKRKIKGSVRLHCGKATCPAAVRLNQYLFRQRPEIKAKKPGYTQNWLARGDNKARDRLVRADRARRHPEYAAEKQARRRWPITAASALYYRDQTLAVYAACPAGMVVDHIVPLRNKVVCGLHTPWNMQYLTQTENLIKLNRFTEAAGIDYTAPGWRVMA